ncbi:MAG: hypothetical protein ABUT20_18800 [Bacteroidota bacterium]
MKNLLPLGRCFYGIGIIGIAVQQFIYSEFRPVILDYWPASIPGQSIWAYIIGGILILAGAIIIFSNKARTISLGLGILFFILFVCFHVYYQVFLSPYDFHLGNWTNPLKELAFSGGAFIIAVSFPEEKPSATNKLFLVAGRVFFSLMLIAFGIDHFLYTEFVATLVPGWIPGHIFWTYFAAVALIGSGICILLKIKIRLVSILLGIMLFTWFVILHIPRAIAEPDAGKGNEMTSVFQALAFSGIAFVIACIYQHKPGRENTTI